MRFKIPSNPNQPEIPRTQNQAQPGLSAAPAQGCGLDTPPSSCIIAGLRRKLLITASHSHVQTPRMAPRPGGTEDCETARNRRQSNNECCSPLPSAREKILPERKPAGIAASHILPWVSAPAPFSTFQYSSRVGSAFPGPGGVAGCKWKCWNADIWLTQPRVRLAIRCWQCCVKTLMENEARHWEGGKKKCKTLAFSLVLLWT